MSEDIKKYLSLFEAKAPKAPDPVYVGPQSMNSDVHYQPKFDKNQNLTKIVANLRAHTSGKYTRLAKNIAEIVDLEAKVDAIKEEIKQDGREAIAEMFKDIDNVATRVIKTVSWTLQLSKDPKAATTVKYAEALEEFQAHLTPELLTVMRSILAKYSTEQAPKPPALKYEKNGPEFPDDVEESFDIFGDSLNEELGTKIRFELWMAQNRKALENWIDKMNLKLGEIVEVLKTL